MKSIGVVAAGFILIAFLGFLTDTSLQSIGVLPITGAVKFEPGQSLLALTYHLAFVALGSYITARLTPSRPMTHALVLGVAGIIISTLGLIAIMSRDLSPA